VTPAEVARVLAKASAYDQRTIGETDVAAWHEIVARYQFADALPAVAKHYAETRDRLMPADLVKQIRAIRDERARLEKRSAPLALPGRFEDDPERDERNKENLAKVRREVIAPIIARMSIPEPGQWIPLKGEPKGAWWEDPEKREQHANEVLAEMGRLNIAKEGEAS
jgi:hypothetical protein